MSFGFVTAKNDAGLLTIGKNVMSFQFDDNVGRILAGRSEYGPTHIGFVYGASDSPGLDLDSPSSTRNHPWQDVRTQILGAEANVLIAPITSTGTTPSTDDHVSNTANLYSSSAAGNAYAFPHTGGFADTVEVLGTVYYYQLLLLNRRIVNGSPVYTVLARKAIDKVEDLYVGYDSAVAQNVNWAVTITLE